VFSTISASGFALVNSDPFAAAVGSVRREGKIVKPLTPKRPNLALDRVHLGVQVSLC
jgi:hypothetical protein